MRPHQILLSTLQIEKSEKGRNGSSWTHRKRFDCPNDGVLLGRVLDAADGGLELGRVRVHRHWNDDFNVVGRRSPLELRLGLDHVFHPTMRVPLNYRLDPYKWLHLNT